MRGRQERFDAAAYFSAVAAGIRKLAIAHAIARSLNLDIARGAAARNTIHPVVQNHPGFCFVEALWCVGFAFARARTILADLAGLRVDASRRSLSVWRATSQRQRIVVCSHWCAMSRSASCVMHHAGGSRLSSLFTRAPGTPWSGPGTRSSTNSSNATIQASVQREQLGVAVGTYGQSG